MEQNTPTATPGTPTTNRAPERAGSARRKRSVELPLTEPLYSTYHNQGVATAILPANPSIRNWYLNRIMLLTCTRRFLHGFTSPQASIKDSDFSLNPNLDKRWYSMEFLGGYVHPVIRHLLDAGYYVYFSSVDDYYVEGKSWYHEKHFSHDGCICGYDRTDRTYTIYAYDRDWVYRKFRTTQKSFEAGRRAIYRQGKYGFLCGIRPKEEQVPFSPRVALAGIAEYLDSAPEQYPDEQEGPVYGIVVHEFLARYLEKLYDGSIPYACMDRRVLRVVWEHKKGMLERIGLIEEALSLDDSISRAYRTVVQKADYCRMLYASHRMRRRDSLLPRIRDQLLALRSREEELLCDLLRKTERTNIEGDVKP